MTGKRTTRRDFMRWLGAGAAALALPGCPREPLKEARSPPNVIFVLVDDLGWSDGGCLGSDFYETPNIDRLAREGMRFTDAYAAAAVCSPTRASILTGRYPARLGITDWIRASFQGGKVPPDGKNPTGYEGAAKHRLLCPRNALWMELDEVTIAEALKAEGYTTCHIGKWHLGFDDWYPQRQGFDRNLGGCDYGHPPSYFDPYTNEKHGPIPTLAPRREGEYLTDREADEAVDFITTSKDRPFFLYLSHYAVHTPIQGRPDLVRKYEAKQRGRHKNAAYAAMIESVDSCLGRVLDTLEEQGLAGNTLVVFFSDNGGLKGVTDNAPLRSGKGFPYEGGIREPLIVRWPGVVAPGSQCQTPVISVDFLPTLLEAAGTAPPADRVIDGVSLMPLLRGTGTLEREALFWHFPHYRYNQEVPFSIVRAGDWKLIRRYEGERFELFNLREDLSESDDRSAAEPGRVAELDAMLSDWLARAGARLPKENPSYQGIEKK